MRLGKKQEKFAHAEALLRLYIIGLGYQIRPKYLLRCPDCKVGRKLSVHKEGLAIDYVILKDDVILAGTHEIFDLAHTFWDSLGGAKRILRDMGHFSFYHQGRW